MHPLYEKADKLTREVYDAALAVHEHFGPGLIESIYVRCLEQELRNRGHQTEREVPVVIRYGGVEFAERLRVNLPLGIVVNFGGTTLRGRNVWRVILKGASGEGALPREARHQN